MVLRKAYKASLMLCCPMTTRIKGHPFEVLVEVDGAQVVVLSDQVKSLDWKSRRAQKKSVIDQQAMSHVRAKIKALLLIK